MNRFFSKKVFGSFFVVMMTYALSWADDIVYPWQYSDIQSAINAASDGDRIVLVDNFSGTFELNKAIEIDGGYHTITLTSPILISGPTGVPAIPIVINNCIIRAPVSSNAIRINANVIRTIINNCYIIGSTSGSNWAIDDWGSQLLEFYNLNTYWFESIIDAANNGNIVIENSNLSSYGRAVNVYGLSQMDHGILFNGGSLTSGSDGLSLVNEEPYCSDCFLELKGSSIHHYGNGYPVRAAGNFVHAQIRSKNKFYSCATNSLIYYNGADISVDDDNWYGDCTAVRN